MRKIVKDIAAHVGVPIEDKDISVVHRLNKSDDKEESTETTESDRPKRIPSIIAKFVQRDVKSAIFKKRKEITQKAGCPYPNAQIYEDVTPLCSRIMYQLRNRKDQEDNRK